MRKFFSYQASPEPKNIYEKLVGIIPEIQLLWPFTFKPFTSRFHGLLLFHLPFGIEYLLVI